MNKEWFIRDGDRSFGPFALDELKQLLATELLPDGAMIGTDGQWLDLDTFRATRLDAEATGAGSETDTEDPLYELPDETNEALPDANPESTSTTHVAEPEEPPVIERDAILLLGRRRAGKTIYLAMLYASLWKSVSGLTMKALSGPAHKMLMAIADQLRSGQWPEATLGTRQLEFEVSYRKRTHLLVAFDYSGEDFRRAFLDEDTSAPEVKKLLQYVDRASAVILLMDPAVVVSGSYDEVADDDFGMVQAVQRIRNWVGGEDVPVVLALTKADRNRELIRSHGSMKEFVLRHYPALVRTLKNVSVLSVSAVQETAGKDGKPVPSPASTSISLEKPLLYCLEELSRREKLKEMEAARQAEEEARHRQVMLEAQEVASANRRLWIYVTTFIILALCGYAIMYMILTNKW